MNAPHAAFHVCDPGPTTAPKLMMIAVLLLATACAGCTGMVVERSIRQGDYEGARQFVKANTLASNGTVFALTPAEKDQFLRKIDRAEASHQLDMGLRALAAQNYDGARTNLEAASKILDDTVSQQRIQDALCDSYHHLGRNQEARGSCERAKSYGGVAASLPLVYATLRDEYAAGVKRAIAAADPGAARGALRAYESLPNRNQSQVSAWEQRITALEQEAERKQAIEEAARKEREAAQRLEAIRDLQRKYAVVLGMSEQQFLLLVLSHVTVLGVPVFSDAAIDGSVLSLWVGNGASLNANVRLFADISDAFSVWCSCDAVTQVGLDDRHFGGRQYVVFRFKLNPNTGRSQLF